MRTLAFKSRPVEEQAVFNLRRWDEVLADTGLQKLPGRVETDRHGRIVMSPPPAPRHGELQFKIGSLLEKLMPPGHIITECPLSTADGVKGVDMAWGSRERRREAANRSCFLRAPEICVEVVSPSNSDPEIREKISLYVAAGAKEVWLCGDFGTMTFFDAEGHELERSKLCSEFPSQI